MIEDSKLTYNKPEDLTGNISYLTTQLETMVLLLRSLLDCCCIQVQFLNENNKAVNGFRVTKDGQSYFGDIWWGKTKDALEGVLVSRIKDIQSERDDCIKLEQPGWSCPSLEDY